MAPVPSTSAFSPWPSPTPHFLSHSIHKDQRVRAEQGGQILGFGLLKSRDLKEYVTSQILFFLPLSCHPPISSRPGEGGVREKGDEPSLQGFGDLALLPDPRPALAEDPQETGLLRAKQTCTLLPRWAGPTGRGERCPPHAKERGLRQLC